MANDSLGAIIERGRMRTRNPLRGAPRGGADIAKVREANAKAPKGTIGLNPFRFSTITISENDYYSLAVFALRYSMGGGTIGREGIIGDVIHAVGFSELAERIAVVFCADYEDYIKQNPKARCNTDEFSTWRRGYHWFKAMRDDSFALVRMEGKDSTGEHITQDALCFKCDGSWHEAVVFMQNSSPRCVVDDAVVKEVVEKYGWRRFVREREEQMEYERTHIRVRKGGKGRVIKLGGSK